MKPMIREARQMHADGVYLTAFDTYCDTGSYAEVARQMGISPSTAKRWSRIGGNIWRAKYVTDRDAVYNAR